MTDDGPPWIGTDLLTRTVPVGDAIAVIRDELLGGLDVTADPQRSSLPLDNGEMLLMPSLAGESVGVKIVTVAPGNPSVGLPRISAVYVLFDPTTLEVRALFDGNGLTALRTPAVSAVAVDALATPDASRLLVFGTGPQALGHVQAIRAVRPVAHVEVVGRNAQSAARFVERCRGMGVDSSVGSVDSVAESEIIACCTSSADPLFDGHDVPPSACVIAMGSHSPDHRELDEHLMGAADVVVEERATALREAGDVIQAIRLGALAEGDLAELTSVIRREPDPSPTRPRVFKGVGMAWQDRAVAAACWSRLPDDRRG
ncbi:ornithine cyclodeaminase family protein [uncultured Amnibacterium sp.]|uniref:ornithine cyclodeaminase family protein n=1 Tax=uncultured Amnibacterium sp. TaxID=1631851 RepID=UPI0035CC5834